MSFTIAPPIRGTVVPLDKLDCSLDKANFLCDKCDVIDIFLLRYFNNN